MKNFIQPGNVLSIAAPYNRTSGQGALVGGLFGVAMADVLENASGEFQVVGVFELDKVGSQAWSVGDKIYWDNTEKECTKVGDGNAFIGHAVEAAGSGAGVVLGKVRLALGDSNSGLAQADEVEFTAGTNLVGVDGVGSNAAPLAGTETRLDALDTAVAAIITALQGAGLMASS